MALKDFPVLVRNEEGIAAVVGVLRQRLGERLQTGHSVREQHGHTTTYLPNQSPDAVAFPRTPEEVQTIVRACADYRVPVIGYGTGTSLEGHVNAPGGGITVSTREMDRIVAVNEADLDCCVEPGVTREALNDHLRDTGLFFPIDPGANASLGGMASTRASGTNAVRYGTMRDNVVALEAVMADGRLIRTARRVRKTSAGYDLTRLLVGSEGTLGIITKLWLRLHGIPESVAGGVCPFPSVEAACEATILAIQSGIPVARIELVNALQMRAFNAYAKMNEAETPALFVEFHGTESSVAEQVERFGEIAGELGGGPLRATTNTEERTRLWRARHDAYWAALSLRPGAKGISTDVCVPISRLAECVTETERDIEANGLLAPIVGHVGDGNFHVLVLLDETVGSEVAAAEAFVDRLNERALAMEGTCTGEHGIGQGKQRFLRQELGEAVDVMAIVKRALDPDDIMNPGKIFPRITPV